MSDISRLTAIISAEQINSLTWLMENLLREAGGKTDLFERCESITGQLFENTTNSILSCSHQYELWLEKVRSIDLLMVVCRMRRSKR